MYSNKLRNYELLHLADNFLNFTAIFFTFLVFFVFLIPILRTYFHG